MSNPPALILGGHYAALPIARSLACQGIQVFCHDANPDALALRSRFVTPFSPGADSEGLLNALREFYESTGQKPVLFIAADMFLTFLVEHEEDLRPCTQFPYRDVDMVEILVDKRMTDTAFSTSGIPAPKSRFINCQTGGVGDLGFPIVLKPLVQTDWTMNDEAMVMTRHRKVLRLDDQVIASQMIDRMRAFGPMVAQEFIPGGDGDLFYFVGYRDRTGRTLVSFSGRKLKTLQEGMGSETLLSADAPEDVTKLGEYVLKNLNIVGVAGVDIKRNAETGALSVIEVNHRFGLSDGILTASGVDLPLIYYRDTLGAPVEAITNGRRDVQWVWLLPELRRNLRSVRGLSECIVSLLALGLRGRLTINDISISDPVPALHLLKDVLGDKLFRRFRHA